MGVWIEKRCAGVYAIVEKPLHRIRNTRCRCVWDPYLKRAKVVFRRTQIDGLDTMVRPCAPVDRGFPSQDLGSNRSDGLLLKVIQAARQFLVSGFRGVVVVGSHDIEGELKLDETFVQICMWTVGMEPRSCRDDVVFCRADGSFRTVRVLDIGGNKFPPKLQCRGQI